MFGKSEEEKRREMQQKEQEKQRKHSMQQTALSHAQQQGDSGAEMLRELSHINDLPTFPGQTLDQFISQVVSTSNLQEEDIESDLWVKEYLLLMYKSQYPPEYGLDGHIRAYALDDTSEKKEPLDASQETQAEAFKHVSSQAVTRSESGFVTEKTSHMIAETISHDEGDSGSSGGILGKLGLK